MYFQNDKLLYSVIAQNIKHYRQAAGMTQAQFCDKIGISLSYLTKIESSKCDKSISLSLLNHIANMLGIDIIDFFKEVD